MPCHCMPCIGRRSSSRLAPNDACKGEEKRREEKSGGGEERIKEACGQGRAGVGCRAPRRHGPDRVIRRMATRPHAYVRHGRPVCYGRMPPPPRLLSCPGSCHGLTDACWLLHSYRTVPACAATNSTAKANSSSSSEMFYKLPSRRAYGTTVDAYGSSSTYV